MANQELTVKRMCAEIEMDMRARLVPREVSSFSELHDYVDANYYGGFCDDATVDQLIAEFGGLDAHEGWPQGFIDFINACQDAVDVKIKTGCFK